MEAFTAGWIFETIFWTVVPNEDQSCLQCSGSNSDLGQAIKQAAGKNGPLVAK
jgi:hypothetical protein